MTRSSRRTQDENTQDIESEDSPNGSPPIQKPGKRRRDLKRKLQTLQNNFDEVSRQEAALCTSNRELEAEVTLLKENLVDDNDIEASPTKVPQSKRRRRARSELSTGLAKLSRDAGKRFAANIVIWFPLAAWDFLPKRFDTEGNEDEEDQVDDEEDEWEPGEREKLESFAKKLVENMPLSLRPHLHKRAFHSEFMEGMREARAPFVAKLANEPDRVFGIHDTAFHKKSERSQLPSVKALLEQKRFLYSDDPPKGYLQHECVLQALRLLLHGRSALTGGGKSAKSRSTYGNLWGLTAINHGLLCFVSTALYFVLTGATEFSEESSGYDFDKFYHKHHEILNSWQNSDDPVKQKEYEDLITYFNQSLFPSHHPDGSPSRFDPEERQLLEHVGVVNVGT